MLEHIEPLLKDNKDKFVIFPVKHHDIWDFYKKIKSSYWTADEIDLHQDISDWKNKLSADERAFIKHILAFFAASDGKIYKNLAGNFVNVVQYPEAKFFYGFQLMMENIHSETYALLIETYLKDDRDKENFYKATDTFPAISKKAQWALNRIDSNSFAEKLIVFAAIEGLFYAGAFSSVFWLQKRGLMPGLTYTNELISRDKALHCNFAVHIHNNHLVNKLPKKRIRECILDALNTEFEFITESLPVSFIGMNENLMAQYLEFVADGLLVKLDCETEYGSENPFDFIDASNLKGKSNLLEKRVGELQKKGSIIKENNPDKIKSDSDLKSRLPG